MPQMFDWIFFIIVILPSIMLALDWYRSRFDSTRSAMGDGPGMWQVLLDGTDVGEAQRPQ